MQLVLIGYMGSGKTTIGKKLAKKLNLQFLDLDTYISSKENRSINELFKQRGEIYFRKLENKYLNELLSSKEDLVLSVGGGTPCYSNNITIINEKACAIYLKSSINTLYNRLIRGKSKRPLIKDIDNVNLKEFIAKHLFERSPYYEQAMLIVNTDEKKVTEIVEETKLKILQHPAC